MRQCAWVYTEGGQFGGRCKRCPFTARTFVAHYSGSESARKAELDAFTRRESETLVDRTLAVSTVAW
jgi:hypothetical protein